jgi:hypothetical protein
VGDARRRNPRRERRNHPRTLRPSCDLWRAGGRRHADAGPQRRDAETAP